MRWLVTLGFALLVLTAPVALATGTVEDGPLEATTADADASVEDALQDDVTEANPDEGAQDAPVEDTPTPVSDPVPEQPVEPDTLDPDRATAPADDAAKRTCRAVQDAPLDGLDACRTVDALRHALSEVTRPQETPDPSTVTGTVDDVLSQDEATAPAPPSEPAQASSPAASQDAGSSLLWWIIAGTLTILAGLVLGTVLGVWYRRRQQATSMERLCHEETCFEPA